MRTHASFGISVLIAPSALVEPVACIGVREALNNEYGREGNVHVDTKSTFGPQLIDDMRFVFTRTHEVGLEKCDYGERFVAYVMPVVYHFQTKERSKTRARFVLAAAANTSGIIDIWVFANIQDCAPEVGVYIERKPLTQARGMPLTPPRAEQKIGAKLAGYQLADVAATGVLHAIATAEQPGRRLIVPKHMLLQRAPP